MKTSQTTRSTMPPATASRSASFPLACPPAVRLCIRINLVSSVAPGPFCNLRSFVQGLQVSSTTQRKLADSIRLRRSECMCASYAPSGYRSTGEEVLQTRSSDTHHLSRSRRHRQLRIPLGNTKEEGPSIQLGQSDGCVASGSVYWPV